MVALLELICWSLGYLLYKNPARNSRELINKVIAWNKLRAPPDCMGRGCALCPIAILLLVALAAPQATPQESTLIIGLEI